MGNKRAILISAIAALAAMGLYFLAINKAVESRIGDLDKTVRILVALKEIPPETRITQDMFISKEWPEAYLPSRESVAQIASQVVGQVSVAKIDANEPILTNKLVPFDETTLDLQIPEGYRAITIGVKDDQDVVAVGGHIKAGMFIDILTTMFMSTRQIEGRDNDAIAALAKQNQSLKAETRTIFQNVRVLAVGLDKRLPTAQVDRSTGGNYSGRNTSVTVALTPQDVQTLTLAQQIGRITLSLRRRNDTEKFALDYTDASKAFKIKLPVVQGPPPSYKEIRGGEVFATPF